MAPQTPIGTNTPQSKYLACAHCRLKKTRCDGNTPCNHCITLMRECIHEEKRKPCISEKALTAKLTALQTRYEELMPATSGPSNKVVSASTSGSFPSSGLKFGNRPTAPSSPGYLPRIEANITKEIWDTLIGIAMIYLPRCNFDIDPDSFWKALELPPAQQPHPSLINAVMLYGVYYASMAPVQTLPEGCPPAEYFVQEIRAHMAIALSDVDRLLDYISASAMLSWWFLQMGRHVEGYHETCATARLAIACGLHQIDEQTVKSVLDPGSVAAPCRQTDNLLGPPTDISDLEVRVGIFWKIYLGDQGSAMMTGLPAAFDSKTSNPELEITTVFPKRSGHFSDIWEPNDFCSIDDLLGVAQIPSARNKIFKPVNTPQTVICALSQVIALLIQGIQLASCTPRNIQEALDNREALANLNEAMQRFTRQLPRETTIEEIRRMPPPYAFGAKHAHSAFFSLAEVRCMAYVVIIRMHQTAEQIQNFAGGEETLGAERYLRVEKKMTAAHEVATIAQQIFDEFNKPECNLSAKDGLCVITGYLFAIVAMVYVERLAKLRQTLPTEATNSELKHCTNDLGKLVSAIKCLAEVFPILNSELQKLEGMVNDPNGGA